MHTKIVVALLLPLFVGCSYTYEKPTKVDPTYQSIQTNILGPKCYQCHANRLEKGAEALNNFDLLSLKIEPYYPERSSFFLHIATGSMPPDKPLTVRERDAIYKWIRAGALP